MKGYLWCLFIGILLSACSSKSRSDGLSATIPPPVKYPEVTANMTGEQLAYAYCQTCHAFPEPDLLPKSLWISSVMPQMGNRMGFKKSMGSIYRMLRYDEIINVTQADIFPDSTKISQENWQKIIEYYHSQAPDSLPQQTRPIPPSKQDNSWQAQSLKLSGTKIFPTTLIKSDPTHQKLYIGDVTHKLLEIDAQSMAVDSLQFESNIMDVHPTEDGGLFVLTVGKESFDPSDIRVGNLFYFEEGSTQPDTILNRLPRPVDFEIADLNGDDLDDILLCGFGNYTGWLAWYEQTSSGRYLMHVLRPLPGAIKASIKDVNGDQLNDIVVLMTQGEEGIFIYHNEGNGKFREEQVLRFPPVWGSSYFEMADMNGDGHEDIIYTNGDNADYSYALKPYHGCRIFLNDGNYQFSESYFYPIYGTFKAIARDYDQDGDIDIGVISYFADFDHAPEEGFVYLENQTDFTQSSLEWQFQPHTYDFGLKGKWLVADATDWDGDGDQDLLLGAFNNFSAFIPAKVQNIWLQEKLGVLVLRNEWGE